MLAVGILYRGSYINDALGAILGTRTLEKKGKGQSRAGCCVFLSCEDRMAHWGTFRRSQVGQRSRRDRLDRVWGLIASRGSRAWRVDDASSTGFWSESRESRRSAMDFLQAPLLSHVTVLPISHVIRNFGLTFNIVF